MRPPISEELGIIIFVTLLFYFLFQAITKIIYPAFVRKGIKELERNPKWITSKAEYYGFQDIDFVIVESKFGVLPCFRIGQNEKIELLLSNDTSTKDVDDIVQLALIGKLQILYGLSFPDKPTYWLSILCYMLDGGDILRSAVHWVDKPKN